MRVSVFCQGELTMKDENAQGFQKSDYSRITWCDSNRDIIEALMESKELLKETRKLIHKARKG
jgi:hypothetical protein